MGYIIYMMRPEVIANLMKVFVTMFIEDKITHPSEGQRELAKKLMKVVNIEYLEESDQLKVYTGKDDIFFPRALVLGMSLKYPPYKVTEYRLPQLDKDSMETILNDNAEYASSMSPLFDAIGYRVHSDGDAYRLSYVGNPYDNTFKDLIVTTGDDWKKAEEAPDSLDLSNIKKGDVIWKIQ